MLNERLKIAKIKLQKAEEKLTAAESNYDDLVSELDSAEYEVSEAESEVVRARKKYKALLEQSLNRKIIKPKNAFEKNFYLVAQFCRKQYDAHYLDYVKIENTRMIACNGYAAAIIKCNKIPENLVNKLVPWDLPDFNNPITGEYPDIDKIINNTKQNVSHLKLFSKSHIAKLIDKTINEESMEIVIFNLETVKIAINKKYLDYAMSCFKASESITVSWKDGKYPIVFENSNVTVLILPIRLQETSI